MPAQAAAVDLDRLLEVSSDLILVTDAFGMFVKVSNSVKETLGYDRNYMEGRLATDFVCPADLENTRDEMRTSRKTGRSRSFPCRYKDKNGKVVSLMWRGVWLPEERVHIFVGRKVEKGEIAGWVNHFDVFDGYQLSIAMYALTLVLAYALGIGSNATLEVQRLVSDLAGHAVIWAGALFAYACACFVCVIWKQKWCQFAVSVFGIFIWIWMGFVTLWTQKYTAAAGLYEVMMGIGSIFILYFRGRQL